MGRVIMGSMVPALTAPTPGADPTTALTWVFDETITIPNSYYARFTAQFTSGGSSYRSIEISGHETTGDAGMINYGTSTVYIVGVGWGNAEKRTIVLSSPATGDLLNYLKANATPKS